MITTKNQRGSVHRRPLTKTQKNGLRQKQAEADWKDLLEMRSYAPIKDQRVRRNTAMLLENQWNHLTEAATNTSIFGPANGVTGGALSATDSYATGDNRLPRVLLPMVRRIYPALMSNETVGVQPMPGPVALAFAIRYRYLRGANAAGDSSVNHIHDSKHMIGTHNGARGIKGVETEVLVQLGETIPETIVARTTTTPGTILEGVVTLVHGQKYPEKQPIKLEVITLGAAGTESAEGTKAVVWDTTYGFGFFIADTAKAIAANMTFPLKKVVGSSDNYDRSNFAAGEEGDKAFNKYTEMGFQKLDTRFTGRADARLGEMLANGRWKFRPEDTGIAAHMQQFEATGAVARTTFGFEKTAVEAGTRRLATSWSLETEEDLKNTNGIDIDTEATQQMSYELQAEIDREMTVRMLFSCLSHDEWSVWSGNLADARWMGERARAFYQHIVKMSLRMRVRNRRGAANFILCTPDVAALLECLDEFIAMPVATNVTTGNAASAAAGQLGGSRFSVYIDDRTPVYSGEDYGQGYDDMFDAGVKGTDFLMPNYCMLGYKGTETYDAGIIYCPYIPIMVQTATDPHSWEPNVGLMTRYGVIDNIFGSWLYYHAILIDSFSQPGLDSTVNKLYPAGYAGQPEGSLDGKYAFPVHTQE